MPTKWVKAPDGTMREIDAQTGEILTVQKIPEGRVRRPEITPETMETICRMVADGKPVSKILALAEMPDRNGFRKFLLERPDMANQYREAQRLAAEAHAERALEVAEDAAESDDVQKIPGKRLHVDTLKWKAKIADPEKYGDKVKHDVGIAVIQVSTGFSDAVTEISIPNEVVPPDAD